MNTISAVSCTQCGGAVSAAPGRSFPTCLFCGADARDLVAVDADIERPMGVGPFVRSEDETRDEFRRFSGSSLFYPSDLREAKLELRRIFVPAWAFSATVETHFTGLVSARTASGKEPVSGKVTDRFTHVLIPGSAALTQAELRALGSFLTTLEPFDPDATDIDFEVSTVTREAARDHARSEIAERHANAIARQRALIEIRPSASVHDLKGEPVLIPVFVGVYRYRDMPYRFVVNGQTGRSYGEAPISPWRVAWLVAGLALFVALLIVVARAVS
ncbi:MAG: hypothetical protein AAGA48_30645 [Myxococcota bacterium]